MGKKRKHSESEFADALKEEESAAAQRPERSILCTREKFEEKESDSVVFRNKEKVLVTCSRRINYRYRHLMLNIVSILPHCKRDNKVESKESKASALNELVELKGCSSCLFFLVQKTERPVSMDGKVSQWPISEVLSQFYKGHGLIIQFPSVVHTMEELKLTGNHLNGSRPILTFSTNFDKDVHWKLLKEMITQIFGTPKYHRKSKPYHDHVFVFSTVDDHIWFRHYQTSVPHSEVDKVDAGNLDKLTLVEVGPRFCLNPIKIFGGSFAGPTLYENPFYRSPNQIHAVEKRQKAGKYAKKVKATKRRRMHELSNPMKPGEFADMWKVE